MTRPIPLPVVRAAVVVLTLAVVLCLVTPMGDDDAAMHLALACCFVLAATMSLFPLRHPAEVLLLGDTPDLSVPRARGPTRITRSTDVFALGRLLI